MQIIDEVLKFATSLYSTSPFNEKYASSLPALKAEILKSG